MGSTGLLRAVSQAASARRSSASVPCCDPSGPEGLSLCPGDRIATATAMTGRHAAPAGRRLVPGWSSRRRERKPLSRCQRHRAGVSPKGSHRLLRRAHQSCARGRADRLCGGVEGPIVPWAAIQALELNALPRTIGFERLLVQPPGGRRTETGSGGEFERFGHQSADRESSIAVVARRSPVAPHKQPAGQS